MRRLALKWISIAGMLLFSSLCKGQDSTVVYKVHTLPDKVFCALGKKSSSITQKLDQKTTVYLDRLQRQEVRLKRKLWKKDSILAKNLFGDINARYEALKNTTGQATKNAQIYSGHLDSLTTGLNFLSQNNLTDLSTNPKLQSSLKQYRELQLKLNASDQIKKQLLERQKLLKEQFQKLGMVKELKQFRKQVFYYQAQVKEYKELFEDPNKLEAKLMELVMKMPQFRDFFAKNSMLGSMFRLPSSTSGTASASISGLQTRAMVNQAIIDRFGSGLNVTAQLRENVQSAQGQLNALKSKVMKYGGGRLGNGGDSEVPDFKPNQQKTKSFLKRLEYGANVQSQRARYFFPVTSDFGLSLGYKLNDKSSIGIGASYKLGWGRGWDHIAITHQGIGLRSYLDIKIMGAFYISGGYEQNYRTLIRSIDQLKDYSSWQRSGLVGLSKKYKVSKKMKGEMKILWDFLSYQQVPRTQAILIRVGYNLK